MHKFTEEDIEDIFLEAIDNKFRIEFFSKEFYGSNLEVIYIDESNTKEMTYKSLLKKIKHVGYEFEIVLGDDDIEDKSSWDEYNSNSDDDRISLLDMKNHFNKLTNIMKTLQNCLNRVQSMIGDVSISVTDFSLNGYLKFGLKVIQK